MKRSSASKTRSVPKHIYMPLNRFCDRPCLSASTSGVFETTYKVTSTLQDMPQNEKRSMSKKRPKKEEEEDSPTPKPKRPRTAYNLFFRDQQEKINIMKQSDPTSANSAAAVSDYWRQLGPVEKAAYFQMAADDKFRYYKEKDEYDKTMERLSRASREGLSAATRSSPTQPPAAATVPRAAAGLPSEAKMMLPPPAGSTLQLPRHHNQVGNDDDDVPLYSRESIAMLASQLDAKSIDFLIRKFK